MVLVTGNIEGAPLNNDWRAVAKIDDLPLGRLPFVRDYGVTGSVSGDLALQTGTQNPTLTAKFQIDNVEAYGEKIPTTRVDATLANGEGKVVADIRQASGYAKLTASATSPSGELSGYRPTKARLEARAFQIRPLLVAVQGSVSDLSGMLDGLVEVTFSEQATDATGELKLRDGLVLMPALGKQIRHRTHAARATRPARTQSAERQGGARAGSR